MSTLLGADLGSRVADLAGSLSRHAVSDLLSFLKPSTIRKQSAAGQGLRYLPKQPARHEGLGLGGHPGGTYLHPGGPRAHSFCSGEEGPQGTIYPRSAKMMDSAAK